MPTDSAMQKGNALEDAVRAIETAILDEASGYAKGTFQIQGKRILSSGGVRHEIDIYVTDTLPAGYAAVSSSDAITGIPRSARTIS